MYGQGRNAVQYMGMIMSRKVFDANLTLDLIERLNASVLSCKDTLVILESIFTNQKSEKILIASEVLQYCIKNCSRGFHHAANTAGFQKSLMGLLKKMRGKSNFLKDMNSNYDNWRKIEVRILYIIQLWYDTFMLEESKFEHIINNYKILREENVTFPPRSINQKNLVSVKNQSPIFDNLEIIARNDQEKFSKKLTAMGMTRTKKKMEYAIEMADKPPQCKPQPKSKYVNIDDISEKIVILQSSDGGADVLRIVESMKKDLQFGKVKPDEEGYWQEIKKAADQLILEWESRNAEMVKMQQMRYLQKKLNMPKGESKKEQSKNEENRPQQLSEQNSDPKTESPQKEVNLLDL